MTEIAEAPVTAKSGELKFDKSDELLGPTLVCEAGAVVKKG